MTNCAIYQIDSLKLVKAKMYYSSTNICTNPEKEGRERGKGEREVGKQAGMKG